MKQCMLDLETLDIGENPVILSIGAVVFDEEQSLIEEEFFIKVDLLSCHELGFTQSQATADWWAEQSIEAREQAFGGTMPIDLALQQLKYFYLKHHCQRIWGNGALADIRWINSAFKACLIDTPWKYHQEMCYRTMRAILPKIEMNFDGVQHNALDDARNQAKYLIAVLNNSNK